MRFSRLGAGLHTSTALARFTASLHALTIVSASPPTVASGGRVQEQRHNEDEIPKYVVVLGAQQGRQIFDRPQVSLDLQALAHDRGLLDFQVGEGLRLDREFVDEAVALRLPPFVVPRRSLEIGDALKVMARTERRWAA
jgi:hypothetical protein